MKVKIVKITDRGLANKERLHLSVLADTNMKYYAMFATLSITPTQVRALPMFAYWFTDTPVRAGDNVILYTSGGTPSQEPRADGGTNFFFFCGLPKTTWGDPKTRAVLLEINAWETSSS